MVSIVAPSGPNRQSWLELESSHLGRRRESESESWNNLTRPLPTNTSKWPGVSRLVANEWGGALVWAQESTWERACCDLDYNHCYNDNEGNYLLYWRDARKYEPRKKVEYNLRRYQFGREWQFEKKGYTVWMMILKLSIKCKAKMVNTHIIELQNAQSGTSWFQTLQNWWKLSLSSWSVGKLAIWCLTLLQ